MVTLPLNDFLCSHKNVVTVKDLTVDPVHHPSTWFYLCSIVVLVLSAAKITHLCLPFLLWLHFFWLMFHVFITLSHYADGTNGKERVIFFGSNHSSNFTLDMRFYFCPHFSICFSILEAVCIYCSGYWRNKKEATLIWQQPLYTWCYLTLAVYVQMTSGHSLLTHHSDTFGRICSAPVKSKR